MSNHNLLICSVGGTAEPLVAALKHWRPERVVFVVSQETKPNVEGQIVPMARENGLDLHPGCYEYLALPNPQDFSGCVAKLRTINQEVYKWIGRGEDYRVVVDFTGGTKCMTAALALHAQRWPCRFSYVGGDQRTKDGVGVIVSGTEKVLETPNPWDALGYQAVEDFMVLFDQNAFDPAASRMDEATQNMSHAARKRECAALKNLADAYAAWDRFDHEKASQLVQSLQKGENDLRAILPAEAAGRILDCLDRHAVLLAPLAEHQKARKQSKPAAGEAKSAAIPRELVVDLLANACRRAREGRFEDGVARLYRATEAIAQVQLGQRHELYDTGHVPPEKLPEPLRQEWANRVEDNGALKLGLQDDYRLLLELDDPLGHTFARLGWNDRKRSPLVGRNSSILAHGFELASDKTFASLWKGCLELAKIDEADLPQFPHFASS